MSNVLFDKGREGILDRSIDMTASTISAVLVRGYSYNSSHQYLSDVTGAGATIVQKVALSSKAEASGVFSAANTVFTSVASGAAIATILIVNDTGTDSTSRLVANIDSGAGLPVTPNGQNITAAWDTGANKIFKL